MQVHLIACSAVRRRGERGERRNREREYSRKRDEKTEQGRKE
jgi:hypothetical protein